MEFGLIEILSSYPIHFTIHSDKFIILFLSRWKSKQYQYLLFRFILISLSLSREIISTISTILLDLNTFEYKFRKKKKKTKTHKKCYKYFHSLYVIHQLPARSTYLPMNKTILLRYFSRSFQFTQHNISNAKRKLE